MFTKCHLSIKLEKKILNLKIRKKMWNIARFCWIFFSNQKQKCKPNHWYNSLVFEFVIWVQIWVSFILRPIIIHFPVNRFLGSLTPFGASKRNKFEVWMESPHSFPNIQPSTQLKYGILVRYKVKDDPSKVKVAGDGQCPYLPWNPKLRLKT